MRYLKPVTMRLTLIVMLLATVIAGVHAQAHPVDPAYQALTSGNVYVDPRFTKIDMATLEQAAMQANEDAHTTVKIAVIDRLPAPYTDRFTYTNDMASALHLGHNALIVIIYRQPSSGATVVCSSLTPAVENQLVADATPAMNRNPTDGIAKLAVAVAGKINMTEYSGGGATMLWLIFLAVVVGIGILIWSGSRQKKKEIAAAREPVERLRQNVLSGIEYLDNYVDVLPKNNPDSDQVRICRQGAAKKYDEAEKILRIASETSDIYRAQGILDKAQTDISLGRKYLDRATGGTDSIPGDDVFRPDPLPASQDEVEDIPTQARGVSFFSSRPAPVNRLVPVTITINGQSRQVLATLEEAEELRQGRMPAVRSFQVNGQYVPWYAYQSYDPYRDYWAYENAGWGGFGGGLVAGLIGAELIDSLFMPSYFAPGYSPYAFYTDNAYYQGYSNAMDQGYGYNDYVGQGAGFDPGMAGGDQYAGGFDQNSPAWDDSGSGADSTTWDSGGSDSGSWDSGGGDSGGFDSGGGGGDW